MTGKRNLEQLFTDARIEERAQKRIHIELSLATRRELRQVLQLVSSDDQPVSLKESDLDLVESIADA